MAPCESPFGHEHQEQRGNDEREQRTLTGGGTRAGNGGTHRDREAFDRGQRRLHRVGVDGNEPVGSAGLADRPEPGPVSDGCRAAGRSADGPTLTRANGDQRLGRIDRQQLADPDLCRTGCDAGQVGDDAVDEERERNLQRQVAVGERERQVAEGAAARGTSQEQRRRIGGHQHLGRPRIELLGRGDGHIGQVEAREDRVGRHRGERGRVDAARHDDPGRAPWRCNGQERCTRIGRHRDLVVHREVVARCGARIGRMDERGTGERGEDLVEVGIGRARDEDLQRAPHRPDGEGVIVGRQQVLTFEERLDAVARGNVDAAVDGPAGRDADGEAGPRATVDVDPHRLVSSRPAGVPDGDMGPQATGADVGGERRDGPVRAAGADLHKTGTGRDGLLLNRAEAAVADEDDADRSARCLHAGCEVERVLPVGRAGRDRGPVERGIERAPVGARREQYLGRCAGQDDAGDTTFGKLGPQRSCSFAGLRDPVGGAVGSSHRAGPVDHEDSMRA